MCGLKPEKSLMAYTDKRHLKVAMRNGSTVVLCGKDPALISKVTEKPKDVNCKHCLSRLVSRKN
jgi:hypothetical protein